MAALGQASRSWVLSTKKDNSHKLKDTYNQPLTKPLKSYKPLPYNANYIIKLIWDAFKDSDTKALSKLTHAGDSPWSIAHKYDPSVTILPNYLIHYHFDILTKKASEQIDSQKQQD